MVNVSNRSDCIIKNPCSEMKGKKKNLLRVRGVDRKIHLSESQWHHSASLKMPDSDPRDRFFYLSLTPMIESNGIYPRVAVVGRLHCIQTYDEF